MSEAKDSGEVSIASIDWLADLLDRVDCEFGRLSSLDCPEYVNPDNELWDEIVKRKNEVANIQESPEIQQKD